MSLLNKFASLRNIYFFMLSAALLDLCCDRHHLNICLFLKISPALNLLPASI